MTGDTLKCPKCSYENIVLTCGFCIQCGNDLSEFLPPESSMEAPLTRNAESRPVAPSKSSPSADSDLAQMIPEAAALIGGSGKQTGSGWKITVPTKDNRKQQVHIIEGSTTDQSKLISFLSICGDATAENSMSLLEWNSRITGCAFAIRKIGDRKLFVLTANWPLRLLDTSLIAESLQKIAQRADQVEAKLSNDGIDRH